MTQLMVSYPQQLITVQWGIATSAMVYVLDDEPLGAIVSGNPDIRNAIINGMYTPSEQNVEHMAPFCPSGNCEFDRFQSIGICTKINNITSFLNVTSSIARGNSNANETRNSKSAPQNETAYQVLLPGRANCAMSTSLSYAVAACKTNGHDPLSWSGDEDLRRSTIYSMPIIYSNAGNVSYSGYSGSNPGWQFHAVEVLFHLCVNTYDIKVTEGRAVSVVSESPPTVVADTFKKGVEISCTMPGSQPAACNGSTSLPEKTYISLRDPTKLGSAENSTTYKASIRNLGNIAVALNRATSGYWAWNGIPIEASSPRVAELIGQSELPALANAIYHDTDPSKQMERIGKMMKNIAVGITNT
jgi:hypothetical protein